jgi:uncharacterized protein YlaI
MRYGACTGGAETSALSPILTDSMKRLQSAPNLALATLWADLLSAAGVATTVQRQYASSIAGEVPPDQTLPELWVQDDDQLDHARALLHELRHPPQRRWVCPGCAEQIDGPFEQCWNCGAAMPTGSVG